MGKQKIRMKQEGVWVGETSQNTAETMKDWGGSVQEREEENIKRLKDEGSGTNSAQKYGNVVR